MKCADGRWTDAEAFMDCGVFEFHYRIEARNRWVAWKNAQGKPSTSSFEEL